MIPPFVHRTSPQQVSFGSGRLASVDQEVAELGLRRVLVLSTPEQADLAEHVAALLGDAAVGVHAHAVMHVPVAVADAARETVRRVGADGCVAVGGGSTIGLGKAIALSDGLPVLAVPTTYAGSEMTPVWGLTENGVKTTGRDPAVLPRGVLYDPELTLSLPTALAVTSSVNALAHAVEARYAPDTNPVIDLLAAESTRSIVTGLHGLETHPHDVEVRSHLLYGAWLAGTCLGATTMGLHHKLCHVLGGALDLPHAATHTVLLPHVVAFNAPRVPAAVGPLVEVLTADDAHPAGAAAAALHDLLRRLGAPLSLAALGVADDQLDMVAKQAADAPYSNPRTASEHDLAALLRRAHAGELA